MRKNKPNSLKKVAPAIPNGSVLVGIIDGEPVYLTPRDRSMHQIFVGGTGSGKTTAMEGQIRQDIVAGRGLAVIDPMGALFDRAVAFCAHRRAIGCRVPEVVLCNPSGGEWVLPFNPFLPRGGDLSVQVDRRVQATLRAWGQQSGDETPRLEKWLKCLFTVLIECKLTIVEAAWLLDQRASEVRELLLAGLTDEFIRRKLEQLARYRPSEFSEQIESVENRLMRFLCSRTVSTMMGVGSSALDFSKAMDDGQAVFFNLAPSNFLSREQQRLIGTLAINEFYETALTRASGSRPFYLYVDEAARFVSPELGEALEQCRQKGLHFSLAFQHLAQFKAEDPRLYKAVKNNTRNKLVFTVPDREDASELADDLFVGLAEPQLKIMHRRLGHLIEDVRDRSTAESVGQTESSEQSVTSGTSTGYGTSVSQGKSVGTSRSTEKGTSTGRTLSRGHTKETGTSQGHTHTEHESHTHGYSESSSHQENSGRNSSETIHLQQTQGSLFDTPNNSRSNTAGESYSASQSHSRTDTGSDTYDSGDSYSRNTTHSSGASTSSAWSRGKQSSESTGTSESRSLQTGASESISSSDSNGNSFGRGRSHVRSVTDQPGTRHHPFWEEDPEHWTLEEQRWRSAEIIMRQQTGHCVVSTASGAFGTARIRLPKKFYILPHLLIRHTREFYERSCLRQPEAEARIAGRRLQLLDQIPAETHDTGTLEPFPLPRSPLWSRTSQDHIAKPPRGRGPKATAA